MSKRLKVVPKGQSTLCFHEQGKSWELRHATSASQAANVGSASDSESTSSKQKYEVKRKRAFVDAWKNEFVWVRYVNNIMFCSVCREFTDLSDPSSTLVKGVFGDKRCETLVHQDISSGRIKCMKRKAIEKAGPGSGAMEKCVAKQKINMSEDEKKQLAAKFNSAFYVTTKKIAFTQFRDLCELQVKNGVNMGNLYITDKACKDFVHAIADVEREDLASEIRTARFFVVMGDGSTDISVTEQEGFLWVMHEPVTKPTIHISLVDMDMSLICV